MTQNSASIDGLLHSSANTLKRLLFPKLLRTLPLPNQVACIDAVAFILTKFPKLLPITDTKLQAFVSELLKMISIADGALSDPSFGSIVLIDKDGFAVNSDGEATSRPRSNVRPSSVFLRKSFVLEDETYGGRIQVPAELPLGIQLRVSTLQLFRGLITGWPDEFYDAGSDSSIGNIRPHVMALLFRSLISEPSEIRSTGESALRSALVSVKKSVDDSSSTRLPKDLIQSCIRPVLMNLKDYTKLSLPLMKGLSRLLTLLSSWFNKSLGEKLIDHMKKFCEPGECLSLLWHISRANFLCALNISFSFVFIMSTS